MNNILNYNSWCKASKLECSKKSYKKEYIKYFITECLKNEIHHPEYNEVVEKFTGGLSDSEILFYNETYKE